MQGNCSRLLIKMADKPANAANAIVEQRTVITFFINESIRPNEIYKMLKAQYGDETLSRSKTFEWCRRFKYERTSLQDDQSPLQLTLLND